MAIDASFETNFALRAKLRALQKRNEELESGKALAKLISEKASLQKRYEAKIKKLTKELNDQKKLQTKMRNAWFEVFEQVKQENDKALLQVCKEKDKIKARAFKAEHARDLLADEITLLKGQLKQKEEEIETLNGRIKKLTAHINLNFENSSLPSSAQGPKRKKIPNTRTVSQRKPGAQKGHPHHPRRYPTPTKQVLLPDPDKFYTDPDLYKTKSSISKALISAHIVVETTEYIASVWRHRTNGTRTHAAFPFGLKDEVTYDGTVKTLAFLLTHECNASAAKACTFLSEVSEGKLNLSEGMIKGLAKEFARKSADEQKCAIKSLMTHPVCHADFTGANVNGKNNYVLILANKDTTCMCATKSKGHKAVVASPLKDYVGCIVHDHDKTFYSYGESHQECMQHNIRYLTGSIQNEPHLTWNKEMLSLIRKMIHLKHQIERATPADRTSYAKAVYDLEQRYDAILDLAQQEYENSPPDEYYRDGYNLFVRLRDYKESELRFLHDMRVPADNSLCERQARVFKRKQHQAIVFRSFEGLSFVCNALSIINNFRCAGKDVFSETSAIFNRGTADSVITSVG